MAPIWFREVQVSICKEKCHQLYYHAGSWRKVAEEEMECVHEGGLAGIFGDKRIEDGNREQLEREGPRSP